MSAYLLDFNDARRAILDSVTPTRATIRIPLTQALNHIVAMPVISPLSVPSFNNSAMDGYAVRLSDLTQSTTLPLAGKILAGEQAEITWPQGTCIRIMTGAPVPHGADAVVMQEETEITAAGIRFTAAVKARQNIRYIGEDVALGSPVAEVGTRLTTTQLATLATLGIAELTVFKPLTVALFSTGDELVAIGQPRLAEQIYDSNRFTLSLMLQQLGCQVLDLGIIADDPNKIRQTLIEADAKADVVITSGGVSVGDADYTKQVLDELGSIEFWKIAMKPGKPFAFGRLNHAVFCGLPGNPVSSMVTFYQLVQPMLWFMMGRNPLNSPLSFKVKSHGHLKKRAGRIDFQRGYLFTDSEGELTVSSTGPQGSHITHSFTQATCFIILEKEREDVAAGELVTVELFNSLLG